MKCRLKDVASKATFGRTKDAVASDNGKIRAQKSQFQLLIGNIHDHNKLFKFYVFVKQK
jgi:hypothetical protein